ncbi:MAG: hypothetical protein ACOVK2_05580 [Candidatus Fonsibacter sp.]|jgi:hypothetical protein
MDNLEQLSRDIKEIKQALLGSEFNNFKGMVSQVKEIDDRVENLEVFKNEISVYVNQFKVAFVILFGALITLLFKAFK